MKKVPGYEFCASLALNQLQHLYGELDSEMKREILPQLTMEDPEMDYEHFITLPGPDGKDLYICADMNYLRFKPEPGCVRRKMLGVRVYGSEEEMELFMVVANLDRDKFEFMSERQRFIFN